MPFEPRHPWQMPHSPLKPEAPLVVLAQPGSLGTRRRLGQALAAGSLLAVAFRPFPGPVLGPQPRPAASGPFVVINTNPSGAGSLPAAVQSANTNPGADVVTFQAGLTGAITLTHQITISGSLQIIGPGPGALAVSGNTITRVFYLTSTAPFTVTISGLTIRDGSTQSAGTSTDNDGAGILDEGGQLTLDNVHLINNHTVANYPSNQGDGGGVDAENGHAGLSAGLTIRNSLISGNSATHGGGVVTDRTSGEVLIQNTQILSNSVVRNGGGVYIEEPYANVTIEDSTIAGNTSSRHGGGIAFYYSQSGTAIVRRTTISGNSAVQGGGLYASYMNAPLIVENSTIADNHASGSGGGVFLYNNFGKIGIQNSTIAGNTTNSGGAGVEVKVDTVAITDTIIANNTGPGNLDLNTITGTLKLKYDLVQISGTATISDAGGNVFGLDPQLGPLANNGGPTQTRLPAANSPAVNAGDPAFAAPPATDQTGGPRVIDGRLDIGAVERRLELFLPLVRR